MKIVVKPEPTPAPKPMPTAGNCCNGISITMC